MSECVRITALVVGVVTLWSYGASQPLAQLFPAHSPWGTPVRPAIPADADSNDATAYFILGTSSIVEKPDIAAAAFYWAIQLDPWLADAYYARAVALARSVMRRRPGTGIWVPTRTLRENEMQVIDSLHRVAYDLNPFIDRRLDHLVGGADALLACDRLLDVKAAGICSLHRRDYVKAARNLGEAIKKNPRDIDLHYLRAQALFRQFLFDSAAGELRILADSLENRQTKKAMMYVSRAALFYAQGMAYSEHGDTAKARAAYERALVEDLSFHMASVRLAGHALATGDSAAALAHLAHAVTVRPSDGPLRLYYGMLLTNRNQLREAAEQYMRAIASNPYYAPPYLQLGRLLEAIDLENAVTSYYMYLGRVARSDSTRHWVEQRLQHLKGTP